MTCERCGRPYEADSRRRHSKRFCSRRCQMNAYHAKRKATDPVFHQHALEYQRLWRIGKRARHLTEEALRQRLPLPFEETLAP